MNTYQVQFHPYQRPFREPLQTRHGSWSTREGIIVQLKDDSGNIGWGEIAPIPWFGSETLVQAKAFCHQLKGSITQAQIHAILPSLPACQFAFESALTDLTNDHSHTSPTETLKPNQICALLPTGEQALQSWQTPWQQGHTTFKWKIGIRAIAHELHLCRQLINELPVNAKLRLDANGGLRPAEAQQWLDQLAQLPQVEYLEQPLPPENFTDMLTLSHQYPTAIALDESVTNWQQLQNCYESGWRGICIVKATIAGSPQWLTQFCADKSLDLVFSSVFETAIARQAAIDLAQDFGNPERAIGFGVEQWLAEPDKTWLPRFKSQFQ